VGRARRLLPWLRWGSVALLSALLLLDLLFPLPLPTRRDTSVVVLARDGTPLRAFADAKACGAIRPSPDTVSPLYVQALLNYEDRWFWKHPGINPVALCAPAGQCWATGGSSRAAPR
jgi:penicillin-binding protein 1C